MEQQKIHEDTWKKKSHSAFEGKAVGMMPFYESLFRSAALHFKGFHKTLYLIFGIFSFIGSHLLTTQIFYFFLSSVGMSMRSCKDFRNLRRWLINS